jgi:hypothetical protein
MWYVERLENLVNVVGKRKMCMQGRITQLSSFDIGLISGTPYVKIYLVA